MAITTQINISFDSVYVNDSADIWGDGEWHFRATVDGVPVGSFDTEFVAQEKKTIVLQNWAILVDVSGKQPGDKVKVKFSGIDKDIFCDDDLGEVTAEFAYPFDMPTTCILMAPVQTGFFSDSQYYTLNMRMTIATEFATAASSGPGAVSISRQNDGSATFTTVSGAIVPRVEVCPIIPVPDANSRLPTRPPLPRQLAAGVTTPAAGAPAIFPVPALNTLANPSLIPALSDSDPDLANKAARLAVTYYEPGDLDTTKFFWKLVSGPVAFIGGQTGLEVKVRGTSGTAADAMAEFEIRWEDANGPVLAKYRAWVGKVKTVLYRVNLINGTTAMRSPWLSPQNVDNHIQMARLLHWQAGLDFQPDSNTTCYDGATTVISGTALPAGVYVVNQPNDTWTVNVDLDQPLPAVKLNFRPGVINIAYVHSTQQNRAAAVEIQGVPDNPPDETLGGSPSTSWVYPSGVTQDPGGQTVSMKRFGKNRKDGGDASYTTYRQRTDPTFTAADISRLYGVVVPADWSGTGDFVGSGVNLAHELGHALGLYHRGSGGYDSTSTTKGPSDDNVNSAGNGPTYGHPWFENIMCYGYANNSPRALDIDLIQTATVRRHPAAV